jgi:hypothetical protein
MCGMPLSFVVWNAFHRCLFLRRSSIDLSPRSALVQEDLTPFSSAVLAVSKALCVGRDHSTGPVNNALSMSRSGVRTILSLVN